MTRRRPGIVPLLVSLAVHVAVVVPLVLFTRVPEAIAFETIRINLIPAPPAAVVDPAPVQPQPEPEPEEAVVQPEPEARPVEQPPTPPEPEPEREERPETEKPPETPERTSPAETETADTAAAGGHGLDLATEGRQLFPEYFANIVVQVSRYLRWSDPSRPQGEVYFEILDDGSVRNIRITRSSGNPVFDFRVMGAIEAAGNRRAFGDLPDAFAGNVLPVQLTVEPPR